MKTVHTKIKELMADSGGEKKFYLAVIDSEGKMQFVNAPLAKIMGLNNSNVGEKDFFAFIQPSDLAAFKKILVQPTAAHNDSEASVRFPLKTASSDYVKWEVVNFSSINKYLCVGYDVTVSAPIQEPLNESTANYEAVVAAMKAQIAQLQKKETQWQEQQAELKIINERLLNITNATAEAIWEWDIQTGHMYRNLTLQGMIGFTLENTQDLSWWFQRVHREDVKKIEQKINNVLNLKKQSWELEYRFLCADNTYKTVYDRGFIIYHNNQPIKMIGSLQDVTEIKALESRLLREKLTQQKKIAEAIIKAEERERTNLGHELHDNVNQILVTARLYMDLINPDNEKDKGFIHKTKNLVIAAINEIRSISKEMVLPALKGQSLNEGIEGLLDDLRITGLYEIQYVYENAGQKEIPEGKKIALFRILQEQLKNIIRHSHASLIDIRLCITDQGVEMTAKDNGVGFDMTIKRNGIGISNMCDRVKLYKGSADMTTAPGKGCELVVSLPFEHQCAL